MKVDQPRVTGPLAFSSLDRGLEFFSSFFCLVMHTNQLLNSTQTKQQQICRKAGRGARLLHAPYIGSYLPFLKPNSSLTGSYTTLKKTNGYTLSSTTTPKCGAIKRVSFTSNYLTLICQSGNIFLFQRVSQSEAIICQSNVVAQCLEIQE